MNCIAYLCYWRQHGVTNMQCTTGIIVHKISGWSSLIRKYYTHFVKDFQVDLEIENYYSWGKYFLVL